MPNPRPAAVGGFVLGGLVIIAAAVLFFGGGEVLADKTRAVAFFDGSVGGLTPGAPVTFRGVQVGSVVRVALILDPAERRARIPVYLQLERDRVTLATGTGGQPLLQELIEAGLRAKLVPQSFVTGQMLVELDLEPDTPVHMVGGADLDLPEIPTIPSDLDELRQQLTEAPIAQTVTQALRTLTAIERVADHLDAEIGPLAAGAQQALDGAGHTMEIAGGAVQHLAQDATQTLEEARALVQDGRHQLAAQGDDLGRTLADADKTIKVIGDLAQDGRLQFAARGDELGRTLADADKALKAIGGLAEVTNGLVAPRSQARLDLEAMLRDLAASADELRDFSQTIDRDPSVVLRGRASR